MSEWISHRKKEEIARQSRVDMVDQYADATSMTTEDGVQVPTKYRAGAVALMSELDKFAGADSVQYPSPNNLVEVLNAEAALTPEQERVAV